MKPTIDPATTRSPGYRFVAWCLVGTFWLWGSNLPLSAGDILRGGGAVNSSRNGSAAQANAGTQAAALAKANAVDRLARTTQALQSVNAMQAAARSAARAQNNLGSDPNNPGKNLINVPNGLTAGGLQIAPGAGTNPELWQGAKLPTQSGGGNNVQVLVKQTKQQALLSWKTFNVGKETTITFDQSAGGKSRSQWIAFNKISDPSGSPSQILGSIKADGQVYLLNQNGIIFGGTSQINTRSLVASSLPINDNLLNRGLLNNPDSQFLFSTLPITAGNSTPGFVPVAALTASGKRGDIVVQPGAILEAPTSNAKIGGRIALIGPNVKNEGTILTPDGQTILAAGLQVGMEAHPGNDATLRGLDVSVGEIGSYGGTALNSGLIDAPRASVIMTGKNLVQLGVINSSTSVSLNGRIDLLANYNAISNPAYDPAISSNGPRYLFKNTGNITLGPGSVTQILPEVTSTEKVVGTELALRSQMNFQALSVNFERSAMVLTPNAQVTIQAGQWAFVPSNVRPTSTFFYNAGQIYFSPDSFLDVAGTTDVWVAMTQKILTLDLRGSELANSPLLRDQSASEFRVRGTDLTLDLRRKGTYNGLDWVGTPLGDASGYLGLIERDVAQLTTAGGSVNLRAGGSVVIQKGAEIDVSGGWVRNEGGFVETSRLLYKGHLVDAAKATPDRVYEGIYTGQSVRTHKKWGIKETFTNPLALTGRSYQRDYLEGMDGGTISIAASSMALDGKLSGNTVKGPLQVRESSVSNSLAKAGELSLSFQNQEASAPSFFASSPTPPHIVFQSGRQQAAVKAFSLDPAGIPAPLPPERRDLVRLSPSLLTQNGFGKISIENLDGAITIPANVELTGEPGTVLNFSAANITVDGKITAPGGELTFNVYNLSPNAIGKIRAASDPVTPPPNQDRGRFLLTSDAVLSTAGLVIDDRPNTSLSQLTPYTNEGGKITIEAYDVILKEGALIDVSGGASVTPRGKLSYGNAGAITLKSGQDLTLPSVIGGQIKLGAELRGFAGGKGGSLSIQAPLIQIGGNADAETLLLTPEFFNQGGFSQFSLTGIGAATSRVDEFVPGVLIVPNTVIRPVITSLIGIPNAGPEGLSLRQIQLPMESRSPVSLSFNAIGTRDTFSNFVEVRGDVVMGSGAVIETDPLASVSLKGNTATVLGSISAPAGSITISGAANSTPYFADQGQALATVYLGPQSRLSTVGAIVKTTDPFGRNTVNVLPGGSIQVSGNLVAEAGAVLDVSGTSATSDIPLYHLATHTSPVVSPRSGVTAPLFKIQSVPVRLDSDAGSITLNGGQMLYSDATLRGAAGGPTALGGSLSIASGRFTADGEISTPLDITLRVSQSGNTLPASFAAKGQTAIGRPVLDAAGNPTRGLGHFRAERFQAGGFDSLKLSGVVDFKGPVSITARQKLSVADGGILYADSAVDLTAAYAVLGTPFVTPLLAEQPKDPFFQGNIPFKFPPTFGSGVLTVKADHIDIGNLSLQNIGKANLIAENGDIRGNGTLHIAGDLSLRAGQIYPTTAGTFSLIAYDHNGTPGSISISGSGYRQLPLSAGGTLNLYASNIYQGGVVRAPLGTLNIGWDGTGTAPVDLIAGTTLPLPVTNTVTLAPGSVTSVSAVDHVTGSASLIPYGLSADGTTWIDPTGFDITAGGVPTKQINISGANLNSQAGSLIDLSGGGDLYAYRWVDGQGGTRDILASEDSFAILPGFDSKFSPYGAYNNSSLASALGGDPGYVNSKLGAGDRIYLDGATGLAAGVYTLLPARYALLPGAYLVTPKTGIPIGSYLLPEGSSFASGHRYNALNKSRPVMHLKTRFEVASGDVIRQRAEYTDFFANSFLTESAARLGTPLPRLPQDGGHLILQATQSMTLDGDINARGAAGGRGGLIDIASPLDILIGGAHTPHGSNVLFLNAGRLSGFGAESLLIGGVRTFTPTGVKVEVKTNVLTVNNRGTALTGTEIILVAKETLTLAPGAQIIQSGSLGGPSDVLYLGDSATPGSGNGTLLMVSGDPKARIVRSGVTSAVGPEMNIGANSLISGTSLILDSTSATFLDPTANLNGQFISLNSGQISIQLNDPGALQPTVGLILAGKPLQDLKKATSVSLLSYSSIDIYGTGSFVTGGNLSLSAAQIRGFNNDGGTASFTAKTLTLENRSKGSPLASPAPIEGTLIFNAQTIYLGSNELAVDQFENLNLNASSGLVIRGTGSLNAEGNVNVVSPTITAARGAAHAINAAGALDLTAPSGVNGIVQSGLGASLTLKGTRVNASTRILLPSGTLTLHATAGDLIVNNQLNVGGTEQSFFDVIKYTSGGEVRLIADTGDVIVTSNGSINVSAPAGAGNSGSLSVSAPTGELVLDGSISGRGGAGGKDGSFSLDVGSLPTLADLNATLNSSAFTEARSIRVRTGDLLINGLARAHTFIASADSGSILVSGIVDASGQTGGIIALRASGDVVLLSGSVLDASAQDFNNAGKGGKVALEAGSQINGAFDAGAVLDIQTGSTIDLTVASQTGSSVNFGQFSGTLHLRAPQTAGNTDLQVNEINGDILGASVIQVEGYQIYDLTGTGTITGAIQTDIFNNGTTFAGNTAAMTTRLLANNAGLASSLVILPGAEIINTTGDLILGAANSTAISDWNLATFRFGPNNVAGVLTLRAAGNLTFFNALSDGFTSSAYNAQLLNPNALLPLNAQSWSYRLTAGADFSAADFHQVLSLTTLAANVGSLKLGKDNGINISNSNGTNNTPGANAQTNLALQNRFQVIRTGSGDIDISTGRDIQLLNAFATIYTAGTRVTDPTLGGTFDLPILNTANSGALGAVQQNPAYPAQFSLGGGDVTLNAQGNIAHLTIGAGGLIADSERQLPVNWLYRRGYVDPVTGTFGATNFGDIASTAWWVDFSNFFEGVGALGGGNVTMIAGGNISNVDAVIPTNARMTGKDGNGDAIVPNAANLLELGGGDLVVKAGNNIDAGVYYIERGHGTLTAGNKILTNSTRSPSLGPIRFPSEIFASETWLPTTLFLGKGGFDVSARSDLLLGPVVNPFLLPGGFNNSFWYKSYFSTYAPNNSVNVTSLGGNVTLRTAATLPGGSAGSSEPILQLWMQKQMLLTLNPQSASFYQPWLRLNETTVSPFSTAFTLLPSTLKVTAFSGNINLQGDLTLSPSPTGTLELLASGALNGIQPNGQVTLNGVPTTTWGASTLNVSDADPNAIPGVTSPFAYQTLVGTQVGAARQTQVGFLANVIDNLFAESGSTQGLQDVLQTKQALHAPGVLHKDDPNPVRLYAGGGNLSGLTLFSPKFAQIFASADITDISLYLQNANELSVSVVSSGRDLVAYNANSALRSAATLPGNVLNLDAGPLAGDIQVSGPGSLEVFAGRNLDLGTGSNNADGTGVGITSIGNARNPYLPEEGADLFVAAGVGPSQGLKDSALNFDDFVAELLQNSKLNDYLLELNVPGAQAALQSKNLEKRNAIALKIFYLVLRDTGRSYATTGNYDSGFAAIDSLFGQSNWTGEMITRSRNIRTQSGGDISLIVPGGGLTMAPNSVGQQLVPPGIITESGGNISIFTHTDVNIGISRIFTLRGGNEILWSSTGDIAAGSSAKTVKSAPPTRVLIDPQSGDVKTDLAGLATGGGIGVLATVVGVEPGDVDLIAPVGTIDAGDAGIRVSGNLNIAATQVLNASNISSGGTSSGVSAGAPAAAAPPAAAPPGSSTANTVSTSANTMAQQGGQRTQEEASNSIITAEVLGYGGGEDEEEKKEESGQG